MTTKAAYTICQKKRMAFSTSAKHLFFFALSPPWDNACIFYLFLQIHVIPQLKKNYIIIF